MSKTNPPDPAPFQAEKVERVGASDTSITVIARESGVSEQTPLLNTAAAVFAQETS